MSYVSYDENFAVEVLIVDGVGYTKMVRIDSDLVLVSDWSEWNILN